MKRKHNFSSIKPVFSSWNGFTTIKLYPLVNTLLPRERIAELLAIRETQREYDHEECVDLVIVVETWCGDDGLRKEEDQFKYTDKSKKTDNLLLFKLQASQLMDICESYVESSCYL